MSKASANRWPACPRRSPSLSDVARGAVSQDIVGLRARNRHGDLGVVVEIRKEDGVDDQVIVVRGGVSDAVTYFVPVSRLGAMSTLTTVWVDIELAEFLPQLHVDGTVEMRVGS